MLVAEMDQNGKKCTIAPLFIKLSAILGLVSKMIYTVYNQKIYSLGKDIQNKNTYTGLLISIIQKISMIFKVRNRNKEMRMKKNCQIINRDKKYRFL